MDFQSLRSASVNSSCAQPHPPPPLRADSRALPFFWPWVANSRGWGLFNCQILRGGDEKRGPPSAMQHFSLIAQSSSAVLSILMCDFLFQLTFSFVLNTAILDILNSSSRILQCRSYHVKINSARHQHDIERTQNRAGL